MIGASNREDMIDPILRPGRLTSRSRSSDRMPKRRRHPQQVIHRVPADPRRRLAEFGLDRTACIKAMIEKVVDRM